MNRKKGIASLVKKFLAAYPIMLPLIDKAINMEKDKKIENALLTVPSGVSYVYQ